MLAFLTHSQAAKGLAAIASNETSLIPSPNPKNDPTFEEVAKRAHIAHRNINDLEGIPTGYYIIAGVFSDGKNLKKKVKKLYKKDFEAGFFKNPSNGLNYVFLEYTQDWRQAIAGCESQFDGKYTEDVWIMKVGNADTPVVPAPKGRNMEVKKSTEPPIALEEVTYNMLNTPKTDQMLLQSSGTSNKSKLIQKADGYFNKMWYAEAADLYEEALRKDDKNYSLEVIQKVADAHYFNTNMEKAYEWYNKLYEHYGDALSADNTFKYAHSLKGTGKYSRAKKLMRLYNKKLLDGGTGASKNPRNAERQPNEVVLDNILSAPPQFEIKNSAINSNYSEFSPMYYNDDQIVYASAKDSSFLNTRRYKWNDQPYLDLYVAKINGESQDLKDAIKFSKKINTKYHEASVTFSPDNATMYFTRNNYGKKLKRDKNGVNHLKIYKSSKVDGEWTEAIEVSFNSDNYSTGHPALSPDGKKLYFVSDMPGSLGETDIFVVDVMEDGTFSEPKNLGPEINTERKEMFPYINKEKIYFSSNGHIGLGGLDIYEANIDEDGGFGEATNLGQPVNSKLDDFSYIVNEETQKGFFASNRAGGKGDDDIYSFKRLVVEEIPENQNAIAGVVTELVTGDVMPKALVELLDENG
ncbi:MAG: cell envelope biogenesis protein OmpA, partial [Flavobacteriales bacterium]